LMVEALSSLGMTSLPLTNTMSRSPFQVSTGTITRKEILCPKKTKPQPSNP
jgi:hypothetical protein